MNNRYLISYIFIITISYSLIAGNEGAAAVQITPRPGEISPTATPVNVNINMTCSPQNITTQQVETRQATSTQTSVETRLALTNLLQSFQEMRNKYTMNTAEAYTFLTKHPYILILLATASGFLYMRHRLQEYRRFFAQEDLWGKTTPSSHLLEDILDHCLDQNDPLSKVAPLIKFFQELDYEERMYTGYLSTINTIRSLRLTYLFAITAHEIEQVRKARTRIGELRRQAHQLLAHYVATTDFSRRVRFTTIE